MDSKIRMHLVDDMSLLCEPIKHGNGSSDNIRFMVASYVIDVECKNVVRVYIIKNIYATPVKDICSTLWPDFSGEFEYNNYNHEVSLNKKASFKWMLKYGL